MERRDLIKAAGTMTVVAGAAGVAPSAAQVGAPSTGGNALVEITPPDSDAHIPGRFAGKDFRNDKSF